MSRHLVLLLAALVVGIGLAVWLLGGGLSPGGDDAWSRDPEGGGTPEGLEAGGSGAGTRSGEGADAGPVLFGRPRRERVGRGHVHGKVVTAASSAAVAGATILLTGMGFGDESVALRAETDESGTFRITEVPAGDDYELRLEARSWPGRTLPGVSVRDGAATALGTLWLGTPVALAGRVIDESDRGVAGATVGVHAGHFSLLDMYGNLTELFSNLDREPEPLASTTADGQGGFRFETLDPGPLTLVFRAPGYEPLHREVVAAERVAERPVVIRLLAGRVVTGWVVDAEGAGIGGAKVAALSGDDPLSFLYGRSFTHTDADGAFRADAAASTDEVKLLASAPGYPVTMHQTQPGSTGVKIVLDRSATLVVRIRQASDGAPVEEATVLLGVSASGAMRGGDPQTIVSGATDAAGRVVFDVPPGKIQMMMVSSADGRFGMWAEQAGMRQSPLFMEGPEDGTVKAGRQELEFRIQDTRFLEGTVRGEDGQPVAGARILTGAGLQMARPTYTDEGGRYRVRVNDGGFAMLIVRAEGFVDFQELVTDLPEGDLPERDLNLKRAAVVTGRIFSADGRPLPGARVRAKGATSGALTGMGFLGELESITDGQGRYVLDGVAPGAGVRIMARHTATTDGVSAPFEIGTGGSVRAPDVTLTAGGAVEVFVRTPDGRPLSGARVELSYDRGDFPEWDVLALWGNDANLRTSAQGRVRQDGVPPCELTVTATHPDFAQGKTVTTVASDVAVPIRVEVSVTVGIQVAGRVLDEGGRAVEGAWVVARPDGETIVFEGSTTDAEGRFLIEGLPDGAYVLRANKEGFRPYETSVTGAQEDLVVTLQRHDPETAARRAELTARIQEVYGRLAAAANDKEREAIAAELQVLNEELQGLSESSGGEGQR